MTQNTTFPPSKLQRTFNLLFCENNQWVATVWKKYRLNVSLCQTYALHFNFKYITTSLSLNKLEAKQECEIINYERLQQARVNLLQEVLKAFNDFGNFILSLYESAVKSWVTNTKFSLGNK